MNQVPTSRSTAPLDRESAPEPGKYHGPSNGRTALSRRSILVGLASAPAVAAMGATATDGLADNATAHGDGIPQLTRNRDKRALSRFRYHNAEGFLLGLDPAICAQPIDLLYRAGIVFQLALSSHLLDVGFDDEWCRRNIGLDVGKGLRLANATGLAATDGHTGRLATMLSPYSKWRNPTSADPNAEEAAAATIAHSTSRRLLDHVREATGHPRRGLRGRRS